VESPISVETRIIALTNKNLPEEIKAGRFRKDLYYRLNVIHFIVPPLRDRADDTRLICEYLIELLRRKYNSPTLGISGAALALIRAYAWPGNVRELKNVLERAFICAEGDEIGPESLILEEHDHATLKQELKDLMGEFERDVILCRLAYWKGNRTSTARDLGVSIRNLQYKLERYDIR
jgi:transcriptional regulator with PAS, ATPase and Fis domain